MAWTYPRQLSVRVSDEMADAYRNMAKAMRLPMNDLIRDILQESMKDFPLIREMVAAADYDDPLEPYRIALRRASSILANCQQMYDDELVRQSRSATAVS